MQQTNQLIHIRKIYSMWKQGFRFKAKYKNIRKKKKKKVIKKCKYSKKSKALPFTLDKKGVNKVSDTLIKFLEYLKFFIRLFNDFFF